MHVHACFHVYKVLYLHTSFHILHLFLDIRYVGVTIGPRHKYSSEPYSRAKELRKASLKDFFGVCVCGLKGGGGGGGGVGGSGGSRGGFISSMEPLF